MAYNSKIDTGATVTVGGLSINGGNAFTTLSQQNFSPEIKFGGANTGITYTQNLGRVTFMQDQSLFLISIILSSKGTAIGNATIEVFPVSPVISFKLTAVLANVSGLLTPVANVSFGSNSWQLQSLNPTTGVYTTLTNTNFANTSEIYLQGVVQRVL